MHVVVNAAMSADGKLSTVHREQVAISGPEDFARVERLRRRVEAILVGIGTVVADDPSLTLDDPAGVDPPCRVVVDSRCRTPPEARVLAGEPRTIVLASAAAPAERVAALEEAGATVHRCGDRRVDLRAGFEVLRTAGLEHILVEGGGEVIFSCFDAGLVDELSVFVGPMIIGGAAAPTLADGSGFEQRDAFPGLELTDIERLDGGVLLRWHPVEND